MKTKFLLAVFLGTAITTLTAAPEGEAGTGGTVYDEGSLIQGSGAVFVIRGGLRCGIPSAEIFLANGFKGENVLRVSDEEIQSIPKGPNLAALIAPKPYKTPNEGDLIQAVVEEGGVFQFFGPVFVIRDGLRCGIPSIEVFAEKGYEAGKVIAISEEDMNVIQAGPNLE